MEPIKDSKKRRTVTPRRFSQACFSRPGGLWPPFLLFLYQLSAQRPAAENVKMQVIDSLSGVRADV